jgi:hypothetical protein
MSRLLQVLALSSCLVSAASAGTVTFGAHAGSSIPNLRDNGGNEISEGWSSRVAPYFGAYADVAITSTFSVQAEVNYAAQGGKKDGMQPVITDTSQLPVPPGTPLYARFKNVAKLDYVEIPVLAKFRFGTTHRLFVDLGPYAGFLVSAKTVTRGTSSIFLDTQGDQVLTLPDGPPYYGAELPPQDFGATTDGSADLHTFSWGVQGGAGVSEPLGPGTVSLEVRGGLGLANIQKDTATNGKNSTGSLVVALGYSLAMGGR